MTARYFYSHFPFALFGLCLLVAGFFIDVPTALAIERVKLDLQGETVIVEGQFIESGAPDTLLLLRDDNRIQKIAAQDVRERVSLDEEFEFAAREKVVNSLRHEFGQQFSIHQTAHYIVCYNTTSVYAKWVGTLLERLHRAYYAYWGKRRGDLQPIPNPLVVIVHKNQKSFNQYVEGDLGASAEFIPGYYNQESNRINLYDLSRLTERQGKLLAQGFRPGTSVQQIRSVLDHPTAERNVATIIHEGTHQLCFNSGMIRRLSYTPLWLSEGVAIYFEAPDLNHSVGWSAVGSLNKYNLKHFQQLYQDGQLLKLEDLLSSDEVFRNSKTVRAAYAQSWALNYFLQKTRPEQYRSFVKMQRLHIPLKEVPADRRLSMFTAVFGGGNSKLEQEFIRFINELP